ncbi:MAG: PBECR2 nuclease fold domain-containing protein, partial [Anaerotignum sp.]
GWHCRCELVSISDVEIEMDGLEVEPMATEEDMDKLKVKRNEFTPEGIKEVMGYKGISKGFEYNPGKAGFGNKVSQEVFDTRKGYTNLTKGDYTTFDRPKQLPVTESNIKVAGTAKNRESLKKSIEHELQDTDLVLTPVGVVHIDAQSLAGHIKLDRGAFVPFIKEVLENPQEIWGSFQQSNATGKVVYRRSYVRKFKNTKSGDIVMVVDGSNGEMSGWTMLKARENYTEKNVRQGKLLYNDEG